MNGIVTRYPSVLLLRALPAARAMFTACQRLYRTIATMKYASLIAGDAVIGKTSFTFLNDVSIPHLLLYSLGIVPTSLLASPSILMAKGMSFPFFSLQQTTMVKDASSTWWLSRMEKGNRPSLPKVSTSRWTLSLQTQGMTNSSPSPFSRLMHSTVKKALSSRRSLTFTPPPPGLLYRLPDDVDLDVQEGHGPRVDTEPHAVLDDGYGGVLVEAVRPPLVLAPRHVPVELPVVGDLGVVDGAGDGPVEQTEPGRDGEDGVVDLPQPRIPVGTVQLLQPVEERASAGGVEAVPQRQAVHGRLGVPSAHGELHQPRVDDVRPVVGVGS